MQPPCEIMVSEFLPNIRGLVSHELCERGESQHRIAVMLGVTQARVSHYLSAKKSFFITQLVSRFGLSSGDVLGYARILADDISRSQVDGIFTLYSIWKNLLFTGQVCSIHQKISGISSECSICMQLHRSPLDGGDRPGGSESEDLLILRDLSAATSLIETSASFPNIMPEVSVNIAMARKNPKSIRDVAAIPGRINKIHGRAKAFVLPEFGCSKHMSNVLLVFKNKAPKISAAMNVKYDKLMEHSLSAAEVPRAVTPAANEKKNLHSIYNDDLATGTDPVLSRLRSTTLAPSIVSSDVFAVVDRGSAGVEPMTYLFGKDAGILVQMGLKLAHAYASLQSERTEP